MEDHKGSVGFQMVDRIGCSVEGVDGGHFELGRQRFVSDGGDKRRVRRGGGLMLNVLHNPLELELHSSEFSVPKGNVVATRGRQVLDAAGFSLGG